MAPLLRLQELYEKDPVLAIVVGAGVLIATGVVRHLLKRAFRGEPEPAHPEAPKPLPISAPGDAGVEAQQWREKLSNVAKPVETGTTATSAQISPLVAAEAKTPGQGKDEMATRIRDRLNKLKQP